MPNYVKGNHPNNESKKKHAFGVWWVRWDNGKYYIYQPDSGKQLFGHNTKSLKREIFGKRWHEIADKVVAIDDSYKSYIDDIQGLFNKLLEGEFDNYINFFPWISKGDKMIWIENQLTVIQKDDKGKPILIAGSSIDITDKMTFSESISDLKETNKQLEEANNRAIELADILVWRIDYNAYPNGDYFLANDSYVETLGLKRNRDGYVKLSDFISTGYPDEEGTKSMGELLEMFQLSIDNKLDQFEKVLVKHMNKKNGNAVYLEHNTKVEKRYADGSIEEIGGYIFNMTDRVNLGNVNVELAKENESLLRAHTLALKSGKVMIWFIDDAEIEKGYFYGNDMIIDKLGLERSTNNLFHVEDFDKSICIDDEEGISLDKNYKDNKLKVIDGVMDSFEKVIVKHKNIKNKEIMYFEHNFEVETRYDDSTLMVRGGFMTDVTAEVIAEKRNDYLLNYDEMTNLKNRNSFENYIISHNLDLDYSLIIVDIDGLKFINDAFGHLMGDKAIAFTADKLTQFFGDTSDLFRIGGDEYAIISSIVEHQVLEEQIQFVRDSLVEFYNAYNIKINISWGYEIVDSEMEFSEAFIEAENLMYRRKLNERHSRKSRTMETVLETLNQKTEETKEHCERMSGYAVKLMKKVGYNRSSDQEDMKLLCKVHDIGKITVAENILSKGGKLTRDEYMKIRKHAEAGYKIVRNIVESDDIAYGVLYHHERIDGNGYPFGLSGDEIPMYAKIISICDAFDVMVSGRIYSKPKLLSEVIDELKRCSGTQFDNKLIELFIEILEEEKQ
ncbi:Cyclic di-GMP phosphodiesterase response regulator RpfG [Candidatus Izimaplasma bacterium HR1]|jgi:diguanylate cyclase (GGDEF)-like protein|uniref:HD domain-containing phosphohydrolase n=1 Tax=Candidatus Izimoplasma sp. HR1 TaxID=1541959 RepID=UPI0004F91933|nr:Cyclic di-GMP phosphodiesterase response regulator RpfG [Candidatus Izimaplasma bacterium HR1]